MLAKHPEIVACAPFYRIRFHDGRVFDYTGDEAQMVAEIAKFEPDDVAGYGRFVDRSRHLPMHVGGLMEFTRGLRRGDRG